MNTQMHTYPTQSSSDDKPDTAIPQWILSYFRGRLSNRIHDLVLSEFAVRERNGKTSRAEIARRIRRKPEQITRWLGSPGNWTIDTLSDLLLAMGLEPTLSTHRIDRNEDQSIAYESSTLTTLFRSKLIDVQTFQDVAHDMANGNQKSFYFSFRMPIEQTPVKATTIELRPELALPMPSIKINATPMMESTNVPV